MTDRVPLVLVGAGDTALGVLDLLWGSQTYHVLGLLDDRKTGALNDIPILGTTSSLDKLSQWGVKDIVITISLDLAARERIANTARKLGLGIPAIVHKSSDISDSAILEDGVIAFAYTSVKHGATVGQFSLLKSFASISFHANVGAFSLLAPYAYVGSYSSVGKRSLLLARSSIAAHCTVGDNCTIQPHSYISEHVPSNSIARGVPAHHEPKPPQGPHRTTPSCGDVL